MRVQLVGKQTVVVSGLTVTPATLGIWRAALEQAGDALQAEIADAFSASRTAGGQLRRNSPEYDKAKVRQGYDPRRGHRTNTLQSLLRPGSSQLYTVTGPFKNGNARITFRETLLHGMVPYAEYYEAAKVRGAILDLAKAWLKSAEAVLRAAERAAAQIASKATEAAAVLARRGAAGARPQFIRPGLGLTQGLAGQLGRQLTQGLSVAQRRALERAINKATR